MQTETHDSDSTLKNNGLRDHFCADRFRCEYFVISPNRGFILIYLPRFLVWDLMARSHERSATIRARTPVTLLRLSRREMLKPMEKYPNIQRHMLEVHRERTTPVRALRR